MKESGTIGWKATIKAPIRNVETVITIKAPVYKHMRSKKWERRRNKAWLRYWEAYQRGEFYVQGFIPVEYMRDRVLDSEIGVYEGFTFHGL